MEDVKRPKLNSYKWKYSILNAWDEINRLDTKGEKTRELKDIATESMKNETENKSLKRKHQQWAVERL